MNYLLQHRSNSFCIHIANIPLFELLVTKKCLSSHLASNTRCNYKFGCFCCFVLQKKKLFSFKLNENNIKWFVHWMVKVTQDMQPHWVCYAQAVNINCPTDVTAQPFRRPGEPSVDNQQKYKTETSGDGSVNHAAFSPSYSGSKHLQILPTHCGTWRLFKSQATPKQAFYFSVWNIDK